MGVATFRHPRRKVALCVRGGSNDALVTGRSSGVQRFVNTGPDTTNGCTADERLRMSVSMRLLGPLGSGFSSHVRR